MARNEFKAGAAKVNITPVLGVRINGDFITHYANYIHDDLFVRALVLENAGERMAFVVLDTCIIPEYLANEFKSLISVNTGIPFPNILVASTHTHAAGSLADVHLGSKDIDYTRSIPPKILAAVQQAILSLEPAVIGHTAVDVPEHVVCRRYYMKEGYTSINPVTGEPDVVKTNPVGVEKFIDKRVANPDPALSCLAVRNKNGRWISILANYSLHYVGDWDNGTISADYFGVFNNYLESKLGEDDFTSILTNGTSGDINIWDFLQPDRYPTEKFAKSKVIGEDLASRLLGALDKAQWDENPDLKVIYQKIPLAVQKPNQSIVENARRLVSSSNYETLNPELPEDIRKLYAREQLYLDQFPDTIYCPIQAFKIGRFYLGALSGEFFAETGLRLKESLKENPYFTISMANGNIGYVPPKEQLALGGYETWRCRYSCAEEDAEQIVRQALLEAIQNLAQ